MPTRPVRCRGCFPPPPAFPHGDCPQLHRAAATARRWSPFTSTRFRNASWRTSGCPRPAQSDRQAAGGLSGSGRDSPSRSSFSAHRGGRPGRVCTSAARTHRLGASNPGRPRISGGGSGPARGPQGCGRHRDQVRGLGGVIEKFGFVLDDEPGVDGRLPPAATSPSPSRPPPSRPARPPAGRGPGSSSCAA